VLQTGALRIKVLASDAAEALGIRSQLVKCGVLLSMVEEEAQDL
jgi:hypothetical protein